MLAVALTLIAQQVVAPDCWGAEDRWRSFNGSMTTNGGVIVEQIGRRGSERVIQKRFGELRVCMLTFGFEGERDDPPHRWPFHSDRVILETRTPDDVRSLDVNRGGRVTYLVNGAVRPLDDAAREWRDNLLDVLDVTWELGQLRGRESSLRGQISAIQGERSSLQGQISSYRGQVSSMQEVISSLRSLLSGTRRGDRVDRDVVEARIARIERRIREFDVEARIAPIQRRLDRLDVDARVNVIESEINSLDVPGRSQELEKRRDEALARLRGTLR